MQRQIEFKLENINLNLQLSFHILQDEQQVMSYNETFNIIIDPSESKFQLFNFLVNDVNLLDFFGEPTLFLLMFKTQNNGSFTNISIKYNDNYNQFINKFALSINSYGIINLSNNFQEFASIEHSENNYFEIIESRIKPNLFTGKTYYFNKSRKYFNNLSILFAFKYYFK